ncbi:hypothetical protein [Nitrincola alkalisediminis]|uniref:hypothetical protein n=1 Tax=Nitrincola alkalisediminis TaxID=1366656 RepID=UPI00187505BB|nr:hypothetical protein [Nitrincola alkalisediminis]
MLGILISKCLIRQARYIFDGVGVKMNDMDEKLAEYINDINLRSSINVSVGLVDFPSKKDLEGDNKTSLIVLVKQAEELPPG